MLTAIMGAMPDEVDQLAALLENCRTETYAGVEYVQGEMEGKPVVHDRMHWTLAEAINTSSVLWHVTGKQKYADDYARFMQYLDEKVLDHVNGSWFHQLDQNNNVIGTVWPGKSDLYHALQATLIPYHTADLSIAPAVKEGKEI